MIEENPDLPPDRLPKDRIIAHFNQGTRHVRLLTYPIVVQGWRYAVQTGVALNKSMALLATLRAGLLLLAPVVILLAGFGGHLMSRKVLQPVAALTAEGCRYAEEQVEDLRQQLAQSHKLRAVVNDTRRRAVAVSKGLEK